MRKNDFEVIVIGGGVLGCFAAREMTRQGLGVCVLEKNADICAGITKANTAVIYPGYDTLPGSLKTRFGVKASREMAELCAELSVPFRRCGSLFTACGPVSEGIVRERYELGTANGVEGLEILSGDEARRLEPNLSPAVTSALFAPTAGTLDPWAFGIAAAENAAANGAVFVTGERARGVAYDAAAGVYSITAPASGTTYTARAVINAAGLYTDEVFASYGAPGFCIVPSKNEYIVLDTYAAEAVNGIVFQERESGKGVTIVPTVGGNVLVAGTDLGGTIAKTDTATTAAGQRHIEELAREILPALPLDTKIRSFAGVRPGIYPVAAGGWPHPDKTRTVNEFTILEDEDSPCLITFAGIKTPGLTCAREIGAYAAELVCRRLGRIAGQAAAGFDPRRRVNLAGRAAAAPGGTGETIVCRCRGVTEGAVRAAARSMAGAVNVNGVKRRTEAGLGRCQGGYCLQNIIEILADELGVPAADIKLEEDDAAIVYGGQGGEAPPRAVPRDSRRGGYGEYADVAILGSGPAGLSAAVAAKECGARRVLILERLSEPGGLLPQCVHRGFGARIFG
ncbi:MAG: FAD-dependent oxidoreductase, partial [Clostridiales Family XIII bacterium]|nr:FAD-dependent oxidoreductase [Clostridiales Family XIII bacterium]